MKGSAVVAIQNTEEKGGYTITLTTTRSGIILPLWMSYKGLTQNSCPNIPLPFGFVALPSGSKSHFVNGDTIFNFAKKILIPYVVSTRAQLNLPHNSPALVLYDAAAVHHLILDLLDENHIMYIAVPTHCSILN